MGDLMDAKELIKRVGSVDGIDLSRGEDLSIAIMNLVSLEEHMYFSAMKTGKEEYLELLNEMRQIRKKLLKEIVKGPEGEVWCISKHLLATSMRLIEVGTKYQGAGKKKEAQDKFNDAFYLYSLFWKLNIEGVKKGKIRRGKWDKVTDLVKKMVDCCKE
ncbi:MAG: hypothetical protein GOV01_00710 [Candidatus Altiarchaeota archaeon]|nr:hypothetical protein [Candidatus Altiarchaeota archaeon]